VTINAINGVISFQTQNIASGETKSLVVTNSFINTNFDYILMSSSVSTVDTTANTNLWISKVIINAGANTLTFQVTNSGAAGLSNITFLLGFSLGQVQL
jgi:hypothetical protein